jgi:hypothetical protein
VRVRAKERCWGIEEARAGFGKKLGGRPFAVIRICRKRATPRHADFARNRAIACARRSTNLDGRIRKPGCGALQFAGISGANSRAARGAGFALASTFLAFEQ